LRSYFKIAILNAHPLANYHDMAMQHDDIFHPILPNEKQPRMLWKNLHGASLGLALSRSIAESKRPLLIIAPDSLYASHLLEELPFFSGKDSELWLFPDWETLPYDHFSPHQDIISERLSALYRLPSLEQGVIITTMSTLMHRLAPRDYLEGHSFLLTVGDKLNLDVVKTRLTKAGYHNVAQVREHGEFAIRGSLIDLFPMGSHTPFRIDLFDNEVDTIRFFSPDTQRSTEKVNEIRLLPAKEFPLTEAAIERFRQTWRSQFGGNPLACPLYQDISDGICSPGIEYYLPLFFEKTASLFDYLPSNTLIVTIDDVLAKAREGWQEIETRYEQARYDISRPLLTPSQLFLSPQEVKTSLETYPLLQINNASKQTGLVFVTSPAPALDINHKASQPLAPLQQFVSTYEGRILFCAESMGRREVILQLFKSIALSPPYFESWQAFLDSDSRHGIVVTPIEQGFSLEQPKLTVLTETQLYGKRVMQRRLRKKTAQDTDALIRDLTELQIGDAVVHIDHGIGHYRGLQTLKVGEQVAEFLCLEYQDQAKLYVPVASLHLVSRYTGADPEEIPINRLGTEQWQRAKRKAAEKVRDVAAELLDLYAKRAARPGHAYEFPQEAYASFAASFPFEETPDQLQAIEQVIADMTSDKPMDRVICGDVGFGKTEVALRAAFLAVQNNKQVAILVPTTLLAQQHFQNFQDRFADWPIQVEMLSRFRTGKEQKNVLTRMQEGKVDIIIGTHKLLQDDIQFKSLGLVIIDEEHRFGVKQKEKFKALRSLVDMLTLTATPIPRTLNMALSGIRDLSVIATPPAKRLSVKTFMHEYQDHLIQEAIQREIMRGGQVYFLHNDVSTINKKAEDLAALVHEARTAVAHGQMHERDLERVMSGFYHRKFNVLVCSTIIESGIDIPTANTIIINRADKFGIAQLHQLRGRVGRSHHQAYAYLLVPPRKQMTDDAIKRLDAITSLDDLGIGFTLATHDLEIRGAGELLGEEQSGDMQEIGFTLYMDLLSRAVDALKEGKEPDFEKSLLYHRSEVDLHVTALIPEDYIHDVQLRLQCYKRIANAKTEAELDDIQVEMIDRFGLLPDALKTLFALSELKLKADALGITKIEANDNSGKFEFSERPNVKPETLIKLIQTQSQRFKLEGPTRLRFQLAPHELKERVYKIEELLSQLSD
jgi:transcription-repair coupling factor (superfamily II helicase)